MKKKTQKPELTEAKARSIVEAEVMCRESGRVGAYAERRAILGYEIISTGKPAIISFGKPKQEDCKNVLTGMGETEISGIHASKITNWNNLPERVPESLKFLQKTFYFKKCQIKVI